MEFEIVKKSRTKMGKGSWKPNLGPLDITLQFFNCCLSLSFKESMLMTLWFVYCIHYRLLAVESKIVTVYNLLTRWLPKKANHDSEAVKSSLISYQQNIKITVRQSFVSSCVVQLNSTTSSAIARSQSYNEQCYVR